MILIDAGGGTSVALAGAGEAALDTILITHLHPDHVSDLPDLLWGMSVKNRKRPLEIVGPSGAGEFPGFKTFVEQDVRTCRRVSVYEGCIGRGRISAPTR